MLPRLPACGRNPAGGMRDRTRRLRADLPPTWSIKRGILGFGGGRSAPVARRTDVRSSPEIEKKLVAKHAHAIARFPIQLSQPAIHKHAAKHFLSDSTSSTIQGRDRMTYSVILSHTVLPVNMRTICGFYLRSSYPLEGLTPAVFCFSGFPCGVFTSKK